MNTKRDVESDNDSQINDEAKLYSPLLAKFHEGEDGSDVTRSIENSHLPVHDLAYTNDAAVLKNLPPRQPQHLLNTKNQHHLHHKNQNRLLLMRSLSSPEHKSSSMPTLYEKSRGRRTVNEEAITSPSHRINRPPYSPLHMQWKNEDTYLYPISPFAYDSDFDGMDMNKDDSKVYDTVSPRECYNNQRHARNLNNRLGARRRASPSPVSSISSCGNSDNYPPESGGISFNNCQQSFQSGRTSYQRQNTRRRLSTHDFIKNQDRTFSSNFDFAVENQSQGKGILSSKLSLFMNNILSNTKERCDSDFEPTRNYISESRKVKVFIYQTFLSAREVLWNSLPKSENPQQASDTPGKKTENHRWISFYLCALAFCWFIIYDHRMLALFGARHSVRGGLVGVLVDWYGRTQIELHTSRLLAKRTKKISMIRRAIKQKLDSSARIRVGEIPKHFLWALRHQEMERHHVALLEQWDIIRKSRLSRNEFLPSFEDTASDTVEEFIRVFPFSEHEMRIAISEYAPCKPLYNLYVAATDWYDRVSLWSICDLHRYGGVFVSYGLLANMKSPLHEILSFHEKKVNRHGPVACFIFKDFLVAPEELNSTVSIDLSFFAATPSHPALSSVIEGLYNLRESKNGAISLARQAGLGNLIGRKLGESILHMIKEPNVTVALASGSEIVSSNSTIGSFLLFTEQCSNCDSNSCCNVFRSSYEGDALSNVEVMQVSRNHGVKSETILEEPKIRVTVKERDAPSDSLPILKESLQDIMIRKKFEPSWLCNRCLRYAGYGSITSCSKLCGHSYRKLICSSSNPTRDVKMEINVDVQWNTNATKRKASRFIPRIVHQTWFEELSPERYPDLVRLQNAWIATGWEYRFYDDHQAREFISSHFPNRFVEAYDSLIPGAFKADLFRLLVLLISGGIYADIDVMPETSMDNFISPDLTFFVPLDGVGNEVDEKFCLWNGFMGSAPGHPFLVRAIERTMNLINNRADMFDIEREMCEISGHEMQNWKIRMAAPLFLCGPCALGVAVNDALEKSSMERFDHGLMRTEANGYVWGEANDKYMTYHILKQDKNDMGCHRFTDVERGIIIASTGLKGIEVPGVELDYSSNDFEKPKREKLHYSKTKREGILWGRKGVYKDNFMTNETITFDLRIEESTI